MIAALSFNAAIASDESTVDTFQYPTIDLSLNSAVLFALHKNPDISIALEKYSQSLSDIDNDKAGLYPLITASGIIGHEYNNPSSGNKKSEVNDYAEFTLSLEQTLFDGFETINTIKRRKDLSQSAYWDSRTTLENILRDTADAYLSILLYQKQIALTQELVVDIRKNLAYIKEQYDAGAADKVIVDYAKSRLAASETDLNRAKSSLNDAISNLEFLTGKLPPNFNVDYPERLNPDKLDLQYYTKLANQGSSSLLSSDYEISSYKHQLEAQKGRDLPSVGFVIDAEQTHNSGGERGMVRGGKAFLRIDYTLFDGYKRKAQKNFIKSQISEQQINKEKSKKEIRRNIEQAYNTIKSNETSIAAKEVEIRASIALKALNQENFKLGNINIIELIESSERLTDAKMQRESLLNASYLNSYDLLILSSMINHEFFCETCDPLPTN